MPSQTIARLPTGPEDSVCQIWVVSDGTPGMRLQAVAMAESLLKARPDWEYEQFTVTPHRWIRALPRLALRCRKSLCTTPPRMACWTGARMLAAIRIYWSPAGDAWQAMRWH
jgi:mitochondrial fission protein ELM1